MSLVLECKKVKRTGFVPGLLGGGLLAAAVPILNMAIRGTLYLGNSASPISILMDANWQMMTMLNLLLIATGACLMYHTEYGDHAIQKMHALPMKESRLYFGKAALLTGMCAIMLLLESAGIGFCLQHWFLPSKALWTELLQNFGYALLLLLPAALTALLAASVCQNMWMALGINILGVFLATMLPADNFIFSLFPFALPFQIFSGTAKIVLRNYAIAAVLELLVLGSGELFFLKIRRYFS